MDNKNIENTAYERYIDATVALFMEQYANKLAEDIRQEPIVKIPYPEKLDERCLGIIKKKCAKQRSRAFWNGTKKALSRVAIILVALLSLSSVLFMTVEAIRIPVINFFIEHGDGFWAITGKSDDDPIDPTASNEFDPNDPLAGLLPEAYLLIDTRTGKNGSKTLTYSTSEGKEARFWIRTGAYDISIDSENAAESYKCDVAGCEGVFVRKGGIANLAWINQADNTSYYLSIDDGDKDMLFAIANQLMKNLSK